MLAVAEHELQAVCLGESSLLLDPALPAGVDGASLQGPPRGGAIDIRGIGEEACGDGAAEELRDAGARVVPFLLEEEGNERGLEHAIGAYRPRLVLETDEAMSLVGSEPAVDGAASDLAGLPIRPDVDVPCGLPDGSSAHLTPSDAYPDLGDDAEAEQGHGGRGSRRTWKGHRRLRCRLRVSAPVGPPRSSRQRSDFMGGPRDNGSATS